MLYAFFPILPERQKRAYNLSRGRLPRARAPSPLLVQFVLPVAPILLLHPDPVLPEVAELAARGRGRGPPAELLPEGGVVRGVGRQQRARAREKRAVHRRRLRAEDEWIVAEQSNTGAIMPNSSNVKCSYNFNNRIVQVEVHAATVHVGASHLDYWVTLAICNKL